MVGDRDASTAGVYEMIRYHLGLDGSAGPRGKRMRPLLGLLAYASIAGDHRAAPARRRGRGAGPQLQPRPRRHRGRRRRAAPPGHPVDDPRRAPGDQHRRPDLQPVAGRAPPADGPRLQRRQGAPADAPVRRDVRAAVRGPVHRHRDVGVGRADDGRAVLRHDRPQDRGPDLRLDRGRRPAGDRRRDGHRARTGGSAGRWASRSSSTTTCWGSGARSRRPARCPRTSRATRRRCRSCTPSSTRPRRIASGSRRSTRPRTRPRPTSPRSSRSSSAPAPRTFTRTEARRYRDEALAELDALDVIDPAAREKLTGIIVSVISA